MGKSSEVWKPIQGFPDYKISNTGRVLSLKWSVKGKILQLYQFPTGHKAVTLSQNGAPRREYVHRLVAFAFIGPPPSPEHVVNHINCDPSDNRVENLEWVTSTENLIHGMWHAVLYDPDVALTRSQIEKIVNMHKAGFSSETLCWAYDIPPRIIQLIMTLDSVAVGPYKKYRLY